MRVVAMTFLRLEMRNKLPIVVAATSLDASISEQQLGGDIRHLGGRIVKIEYRRACNSFWLPN